MSDLEEVESAPAAVGLVDFSVLRTAEDFSEYSFLELQWNGMRFAAVPALVRDGGVLLVLPGEAFSEEELILASADGFTGLIGPFVNGSCTLRGSRRTELQSEVQVLMLDLDSDTLGDPESDGVLALCTEDSPQELSGFGLVGSLSLAFGGGGPAIRGALPQAPQAGSAGSLASQSQYPVHDRRRIVPGLDRLAISLGDRGYASDPRCRRSGHATGGPRGSGARAGDLSDGSAVGPAGHRTGHSRGRENRHFRATAFRGGGRARRAFFRAAGCLARGGGPPPGEAARRPPGNAAWSEQIEPLAAAEQAGGAGCRKPARQPRSSKGSALRAADRGLYPCGGRARRHEPPSGPRAAEQQLARGSDQEPRGHLRRLPGHGAPDCRRARLPGPSAVPGVAEAGPGRRLHPVLTLRFFFN